MVDTETGEITEKTLSHEGNAMREFYAALEPPVVVGIEATGAMQWFLEFLEGLGGGMSGRSSRQDPCGRDPETETRSTGCPLVAGPAADEGSLSGNLDAIDGAAGLANLAAGPTPVGEDASTLAAHLAGDGAQSRPASRSCPVECRGAECCTEVALRRDCCC